MEGGLLLDVVIGQRATVLQLLASENQALLVGRDPLFVLDLRLDVINRVRGLHVQSDGLSSERLDEDLHTAAQAQNQMEGGLLLDVVIGQRATVLQLLACEDQTLLVGRDPLFVLDLRLDVINRVRGLDVQSDGLPSKRLNEDLHTAAQAQNQMEGGLLLDVVIGQRATVLQLLASENQALLVGRDPDYNIQK